MSESLTAKPWSERHIADLRSYHQPCGWSCASKTKGEECWAARWLATLAAARSSPAPAEGLDVERLAQALNESVGTLGWLHLTPPSPVEEWRENARILAAEYARLSPPVDRDAPREGMSRDGADWGDAEIRRHTGHPLPVDRDAPREPV